MKRKKCGTIFPHFPRPDLPPVALRGFSDINIREAKCKMLLFSLTVIGQSIQILPRHWLIPNLKQLSKICIRFSFSILASHQK